MWMIIMLAASDDETLTELELVQSRRNGCPSQVSRIGQRDTADDRCGAHKYIDGQSEIATQRMLVYSRIRGPYAMYTEF